MAQPLARIRLTHRQASDRRGSRRDRRVLDATLKYAGRFSEVEVLDLSERGAFVVADDEVPVLADTLTLAVELPEEGTSVLVVGRVRRVGLSSRELGRRGGFGVEFTRFYSDGGRRSLSRHLAA
ncbi:MAG TPA: PilZ domain-containing protein [Myxococcota bacterium]|nr:PilZ domain-containing protein [Myxococcota bacterium]HRY94649.1 PilZ domain-containing protein [Myxococcota bacterium]HSA20595.1 PilZ domain-containing protein [Myxococcota bacterium]